VRPNTSLEIVGRENSAVNGTEIAQ